LNGIVGATAQRFFGKVCLEGSHYEDGNVSQVPVTPDGLNEFDTIHHGHLKIGENQARGRLLQFLYRRISVLGFLNGIPFATQRELQDDPGIRIIFHQENQGMSGTGAWSGTVGAFPWKWGVADIGQWPHRFSKHSQIRAVSDRQAEPSLFATIQMHNGIECPEAWQIPDKYLSATKQLVT
jgi:hypothetical protein